jgi:glycosyltransferase involved in cell wall biosynthesis
MTVGDKYHIAVVNSHPIQYFAPLYRYLNRNSDIDVTALYCSDFSLRGGKDPGFGQNVQWNVDLLSGYRSIFLGARATKRVPGGFFSLICPEVWREVRSGHYDAVCLHGYAYAANVLAFLAAKSCGASVFLRSETHLKLLRSSFRRRLRDGFLRIAYKFVDGFLAIGTENRAYYQSLGVPDEKIFDVPYTVDNDRFVGEAREAMARREMLRAKYGVTDDWPVILYASKFMRRKNPDCLIRAAARLRDDGVPVSILMVGTGEMADELQALVHQLQLDHVVFTGFVNQAELPEIYVISDVFVLPSANEPWGLIVNEAMCAGLPIVASAEIGCVSDLVKDGVNGAHVEAGNVESLANALKRIVSDDALRQQMGNASIKIIEKWSYAQCEAGWRRALECCVGKR